MTAEGMLALRQVHPPSAIRRRGKTPHVRGGLVKMSSVLQGAHKRRPCFVRVDGVFQGMLSRMQMHLFRRSNRCSVRVEPMFVFFWTKQLWRSNIKSRSLSSSDKARVELCVDHLQPKLGRFQRCTKLVSISGRPRQSAHNQLMSNLIS